MATWREKLLPASFRGVAFNVDSGEGTFGRRTQVHEYPKRDKPFAEDMGRATREFSVTGFLIGDDYMAKRDRLLEALETKGSATLVDPWYGELKVTLKEPARVRHSRDEGGMCTFTMVFVESGELSFPAATNSHGAQTLGAADKMQAVTSSNFESKFKIDGFPSFVLDGALATFSQNLSLVESALAGTNGLIASPLSTLQGRAGSLLPNSSGLASSVFSLFNRGSSVVQALSNIFGGGGSSARNRDSVQALVGLSSSFNERANVAVPTNITPSRQQVATNTTALNDLFSNAMLVQAAGMTAAMELPVYDDAVAIRTGVVNGLDKQSLGAPDDVYLATQDLRSKVYKDVTSRLGNSARMTTISPQDRMPALVLAYDRYGDVGRELEIVGLNAVRRPGFLPNTPIKVLST